MSELGAKALMTLAEIDDYGREVRARLAAQSIQMASIRHDVFHLVNGEKARCTSRTCRYSWSRAARLGWWFAKRVGVAPPWETEACSS